jgi:hypothetical protein
MANSSDIPPGWGSDPLSSFFELARGHAFGSFHNLKREYGAIRAIDIAFLALIDGWFDPENVFAAPLAVRAFASFRAASQLALSGQLSEAYMVMRGCLEHALYANYMDAIPHSWPIWSKRDDDEAARKLCAKTFSARNLFEALRNRTKPLGDMAGALYERAIEFGAHPNEMAVGSTMEWKDAKDGGHTFEYSFLSGDGLPLRLCLKSVAQTGLIVLDILCLVFPARCRTMRVQEIIAPVKPHF